MKHIRNQLVINPFDSEPIQVGYDIQRSSDGKPILDDVTGQPKLVKTDMTTALAIRNFISGAFDPKETSLADGYTAIKILDVLRPFKLLQKALGFTPPKKISLEDAEYEWLIKNVKERGAKFWGILVAVYVKAIEDLEKPYEDANTADAGSNSSKPERLAKSGKS